MEILAHRIGSYLAEHLGLDEERQSVLSFGALALLQNGASALLTLLLSALIGALTPTLFAVATAALLRHFSGGVHLSTPLRCTILTGLLFPVLGGTALWLSGAGNELSPAVRLAVVALALLLGLLLYLQYAPVAAATRPLKPAHRARLRQGTIRALIPVAIVILFGLATGSSWAMGMLGGLLMQAVTLTPVGHSIASLVDSVADRCFRR